MLPFLCHSKVKLNAAHAQSQGRSKGILGPLRKKKNIDVGPQRP